MSTTSTKRNAAGWATDDSTPKPPPVVTVEIDTPAQSGDFLQSIAEPDPAWTELVPEHLKERYLSLDVPEDALRAAVSGKLQEFAIITLDPLETDEGEYARLQREANSSTPTARGAVHNWRLREAARLHEQEQCQLAVGFNIVPCPTCASRTQARMIIAIPLDSGGTFAACEPCRDEYLAEYERRQAEHRRNTDPVLVARANAIAAAFGQEVTP